MALATLGGSLIVRLGRLAIDCFCCTLCRGESCQANSDCAEGCSCVRGACRNSCLSDEDCPEGYVCVNGSCVPRCQGDPCLSTPGCGLGCSCVDGQCWPNSDLYFCAWDSVPEAQEDPQCDPDVDDCPRRALTRGEIFDCENDLNCADTLPERTCRRGKPEDDDLIHDGPFITYTECCGRSCKCLYRCQADTACTPWPTGEYSDENDCNANCGQQGDIGACCETRRLRDENDSVYRYERGPAPAPCPRTRATCVSEEDVRRSFRPAMSDCALCPSTLLGACCTEDGCVDMSTIALGKPIDRFECEEILNGEFKSAWIDCRQHRDPTISTQFACEDCNGKFDCDCPIDKHCVSRQCVPCLDQVVEVPLVQAPAWHDTGVRVESGYTVRLFAKRCDDRGWGTTIRSQVGGGFLQTGGPDDEYVANDSGQLLVRLERQGQPAAGQLCVEIVPPPSCTAVPQQAGQIAGGGWQNRNPDGTLTLSNRLPVSASFRLERSSNCPGGANPNIQTGALECTFVLDAPARVRLSVSGEVERQAQPFDFGVLEVGGVSALISGIGLNDGCNTQEASAEAFVDLPAGVHSYRMSVDTVDAAYHDHGDYVFVISAAGGNPLP